MKMESRLLIPVTLLIGFGLLSVYSASMPLASANYDDGFFFFRKQMIWATLAAVCCFLTSRLPLSFWHRTAPVLFFSVVVFLVLMRIGGFATVRNGAARWISLGPLTFQPSEFARPLFVLFLARILSGNLFEDKFEDKSQKKKTTGNYMTVVVMAGMMILAIGIQPDFGGAALLATVMFCILFVAGAPWKLMGGMIATGAVLGLEVILSSAYKRGRLLAFLDPWADADVYGFQLIQSYLALGNGGLFGQGVGLGGQKLFYLPEAHTDFIVSVIGEEFGLLGTLSLVALVAWFLFEIFRITQRCSNQKFYQYVGIGMMSLFGCAYLINFSVATGLLPTKGLALPLISYGGSALMASGVMIGILCRMDMEVGVRRCA